MKARIEKAKGSGEGAVWLFLDRVNGDSTADDLKDQLRIEDAGDVAYAMLECELPIIRDAISRYLNGD